MSEHYYAVIMAGGGGTRLWPLSRQARPKQMLALFDERTLFQISVTRLSGLFPYDRIYIVTTEDQAKELQVQCPEIPAENYLLETLPRGTASVVGLGAIALQNRDPQAVMAVLTADHFIGDEEKFRQLLVAAEGVARDDFLVTLGIEPTYPATGFGYIQQGEKVGVYNGLDVYQVLKFKEKPQDDQARRMLADGNHTWNSGMFIWEVHHVLSEFELQMPELAAGLSEISRSWNTPERSDILTRVWQGLKTETIDYGIMEGAKRVAVIPARGLVWNDVGSWESLFDVMPRDQDGNIVLADRHIGLNTHGSLIFANQKQRLIVTIGVEGLVVVDTGDVLLVCKKDDAQMVRQIVGRLKNEGTDYV